MGSFRRKKVGIAMMDMVEKLKQKVLSGERIGKEEAMVLYEAPLEQLCQSADEIRKHFCENIFDICTIINGKSGRCSEDCKYCAQSVHYPTKVEEYPLLSEEEIVTWAKYNDEKGVLRYSIVTSGKTLSDQEVEELCETVRQIRKETEIAVCASLGLLKEEQFQKLKDAGVSRIHNNLETSKRNFKNICTTHTYEDKIKAIRSAKKVGLSVCSGGILGLGETIEDRIDLALSLRELGIRSVPVNVLNPILGTPYENQTPLTMEEVRRAVAVFRFLLPDASIRLAGGRGLLEDKGRSCFTSGANAVISGDMLTTAGITVDNDLNMIEELGYRKELWDDERYFHHRNRD